MVFRRNNGFGLLESLEPLERELVVIFSFMVWSDLCPMSVLCYASFFEPPLEYVILMGMLQHSGARWMNIPLKFQQVFTNVTYRCLYNTKLSLYPFGGNISSLYHYAVCSYRNCIEILVMKLASYVCTIE